MRVARRYGQRLEVAIDCLPQRKAEAMMSAWFAPARAQLAVLAWAQAACVRQLIRAAVAAETTGSMLVADVLLRSELPAPRQAAWMRKYERDRAFGVNELTAILTKVRRYAQVPDEPELLRPHQDTPIQGGPIPPL